MKNRAPSFALNKGDLIAIVAPGWSTEIETVRKAESLIKRWGYTPWASKDLFLNDRKYIESSSREVRFSQFREALLNPQVKAIWCLRGGYGSIHLIPFLKLMKKPESKKILIGISDITSLHLFFQTEWGWPSWHGPLLDRVCKGPLREKDVVLLKSALSGKVNKIRFSLKKLNSVGPSKIKSQCLGGNLTVFCSHVGSLKISPKSKYIFIFEDLGERAYRIDRYLEQLYQSGVLNHAEALLFGDFTLGKDPDGIDRIKWIQESWAKRLNIPVLRGLEIGHGKKQKLIALGTQASLHLQGNPYLEVELK